MKKGYTLIELLVGLSIIGLLFGFGYVSFRDFSRRQSLAGTAKKIQGHLRLSQQESLSGRKPDNSACNTPNSLTGFIFNVYSANAYKIQARCTGGDVLVRDVELPEGVTIQAPNPNPILFKVVGQGTNIGEGSTATITVVQTQSGNSYQVIVTSSGEIQ